MLERLKELEKTYIELNNQLYDPNISTDPKKIMELSKKKSAIEEVYQLYQEYKSALNKVNEAKDILENEKDNEMIELAKAQLEEWKSDIEIISKKLEIALLPQDPNDDKNIYLEIRPAAWWDEAWLFGTELMRAYLRFAENLWRKSEIIEHQTTGIWWLKFAMIKISWEKVYSKLKFESWVHRVQRIPLTESWWRIHTSTVTIAIMPEVKDVEININPEDIELTTYAASSAWWQHANKNETWVRLIHKPTWIIVTCWEWRSQLQNKEKAMNVLKAKIYQMELEKQQSEQKDARSNQIGSWDRSEKIRTYNFPQDRVTDHRIKKSWSNLPWIMEWELNGIINDVIMENQAKLLASNTT